MALATLEVRDFRCIESAKLELDPRLTLISGPNGSGKTSLLEALYFLGTGRSFRSPHLDSLIRIGTPSFMVVGQMADAGQSVSLGVRATRQGSELRLGGQPAKGFAQMAATLPAQVIDPEVHRLLEDGPIQRRRYLDWGVFHVEHAFIGYWRRYQRALKQRNAALRTKLPSGQVRLWDTELADAGSQMSTHRSRYVAELIPYVRQFGEELLGRTVNIVLSAGWAEERGLARALEDAWPRDQQRGTTTVGPHRADLQVRVQETLAKDHVSRGQQKLLAATLLLAQIQHRASTSGVQTALLLDDPAAELDVDNLSRLLRLVATIPAQLIVTALDPSRLDLGIAGRRFHVEQGKVVPVLYSPAT